MGESLGVVVALSAGFFSFLSPCVLPLFPSYISFITGMSVADLTTDLGGAARRRVLLHALAFIFGFGVVFVSLGASFSVLGQLLLDYRVWIRRIGGLLIVVFGLYIVGVLRIGFLGRTQQLQLRQDGIDHGAHGPQGMIRRHTLLQREVAPHLGLRVLTTTHARLLATSYAHRKSTLTLTRHPKSGFSAAC